MGTYLIVCNLFWTILHGADCGTDIVRIRSVVAAEIGSAVSLEGRVDGGEGIVGGELLVVYAEAVAGSVRVGEHASLQHFWIEGGPC